MVSYLRNPGTPATPTELLSKKNSWVDTCDTNPTEIDDDSVLAASSARPGPLDDGPGVLRRLPPFDADEVVCGDDDDDRPLGSFVKDLMSHKPLNLENILNGAATPEPEVVDYPHGDGVVPSEPHGNHDEGNALDGNGDGFEPNGNPDEGDGENPVVNPRRNPRLARSGCNRAANGARNGCARVFCEIPMMLRVMMLRMMVLRVLLNQPLNNLRPQFLPSQLNKLQGLGTCNRPRTSSLLSGSNSVSYLLPMRGAKPRSQRG